MARNRPTRSRFLGWPNHPHRLLLVAAVLVLAGAGMTGTPAHAKPNLVVEIGWGDRIRAWRWTPMFVTVSDDRPRNAVLEVHARHGGTHMMLIRQGITLNPNPVTYPLYVSMAPRPDEAVIYLRDPDTRRELARVLLQDPDSPSPRRISQENFLASGFGQVLLGISGSNSTSRLLEAQFRQLRLASGYLPPERLPAVSMGYQCLDVLVLNQPDMARLGLEQQQAIADWVRAGGNLVVLPAADPFPPVGPIASILPCRIGENRSLELSPQALAAAGLPERFARLGGRDLEPSSLKAQPVTLLGAGGPVGYEQQVGFGQVLVMPFDASQLQFRSEESADGFWRPILSPMVALPPKDNAQPTGYWNLQPDVRQQAAQQHLMDVLGTIPGVGRFGFSSVALALLGLMIVVGPVDWFILKRLQRQPWTWLTTAGWAGVVTCAALYMGSVIKSGDLHYRTLRVVDQADGATVATHELACIYAPKSDEYELKAPDDSWWQPVSDGNYWANRRATDVPCRQDYRGNRPEPMRVTVWNLRFMQGDMIEPGAAIVQGTLSRRYESELSSGRIVGTLTNRGPLPLRNVCIRVQGGYCRLAAPIAPGQTVAVDEPVGRDESIFPEPPNSLSPYQQQPRAYGPMPRQTPAADLFGQNLALYAAAGDLAGGRTLQIDRLLKAGDDYACVYAEIDEAAPATSLLTEGARQQHWQVLRALLPMAVTPADAGKRWREGA